MNVAHELASLLGADRVDTSAAVLAQHSHGESYAKGVIPAAVVYPQSTAEVAALLQFASREGVPVTPVGANSSLEGHTVPAAGGISLDLGRMDLILEAHPEDLLAVVQPAVTYPRLNEHVRRHGLFFPIDPGAHASLGGMVSTNASGTAAVRYGTTGDYVLALEVVTPTGEILRLGNRARKSASGYDLCALFTGAEGTLGVITEVTVRLVGLPEAAAAARLPFPDAFKATSFVTRLIQAGVPVARCELVDAATRHTMLFASNASHPGLESLVTDVAVPISNLPEALTAALDDCAANGFDANLVGHVGDGNFHLTLYMEDDPARRVAAQGIVDRMTYRALDAGGTATGEHGVGLRKLKYMEREHGAALALMRAIKDTLDPAGIMNPGKKLPKAAAG